VVAESPPPAASLRELRAYAAQNPDALIIPTHDIGVWEDLQDG
jgi:hypothetical protein